MKLGRKKAGEAKPRLKAAEVLSGQENIDIGGRFDPERDLTEEDFAGMKELLDSLRQLSNLRAYINLAMKLAILYPERRMDLGLDDDGWKAMKEYFDSERKVQRRGGHFIYLTMKLAILYPKHRADLGLEDDAWEGMKEQVYWEYKESSPVRFLDLAMYLAILYPERRTELALDGALTMLREWLDSSRQKSNWSRYSYTAIRLAIVYPEHKAELQLDDKAWTGMMEQLESLRQGSFWRDFTELAMQLAVLASDGVEISDTDGLKLIREQRPMQAQTPLPERPAA